MTQYDITVAVTAHGESLEAGPALQTAHAAIELAEAEGVRVERIVGLDNATPATQSFFNQPALDSWTVHHHTFADQGKTRNALAQAANGRYLAFLDADDLFSENWLLAAYALLEEAGGSEAAHVAHPELIWQFDGSNTVYTQPAQDSAAFSMHHLAIQNYYDALAMAPTRAWREIPFADRDIAGGYAYEDWQWALETIARGWRHLQVTDTIIFKRRRNQSQSEAARQRGVTIRPLPSLRIDQMKPAALSSPERT